MLENTKRFIDYFRANKIPSDKALILLKGRTDLNRDEKNFIYLYCYPRPLLDKELKPRVSSEHIKRGDLVNKGTLIPNTLDVTLILEAGQTTQYGRFIKHLMYAFCNESKVIVVEGADKYECPICGKTLLGKDLWTPISDTDKTKESLAFGSTESSVALCLDCLVQLNSAYDTVNVIDPGFLDWTKRIKTSE